MRHPSRAVHSMARAANLRGASVHGRPLTAVQVDSWRERHIFVTDAPSYPGRPIGGSVSSYPDDVVDVIVGFAAALNERPDSFSRSVLVAFRRGVAIDDRAIRDAYKALYRGLDKYVKRIQKPNSRIRYSKGMISGPFDGLTRRTLIELAFNKIPIPDGVAALVEMVGLPAEIVSYPPDEEAKDFPSFAKTIRSIALKNLLDEAHHASRDELTWASDHMAAILLYAVSLARYVEKTGSNTTCIDRTNPSANHVYRALIAGGRALNRRLELGRPGQLDYMAAFGAPVLLAVLHHLPPRARDLFEVAVAPLQRGLSIQLARLSLVDSVDPELRQFLGFNNEKLRGATNEERSAVRAATSAWAESHPEQAAIIGGQRTLPPIDTDESETPSPKLEGGD